MVQILTDSAADFEPYELEEKNIFCAKMRIAFGDKEYKDGENLSKDEFYRLLEEYDEFPKTSQPSPYEYEKYLSEFKENGDECVVITVSSALSGTYQTVVMTRDMTEYENCYIVDSLNVTAGQKILVEEAVRLRDEGKSAREIAEILENLKGKVVLTACVDTLEYLYKGGRLSKAVYAVASMANIKPIVELSREGTVEVPSKTFSIKQGIRNICETVSERKPNEKYPLYVLYSYDRKNAEILIKKLGDLGYEIPENHIINIGATIGSHVGKGACGCIYISD